MPAGADTISASKDRPLNYAAASRRGRRWQTRSIIFAILLVLGGVGWRWGTVARRQAQVLYWQRKCLTYTATADQVVYDEEPAAAARLLARSGGEYAPYP